MGEAVTEQPGVITPMSTTSSDAVPATEAECPLCLQGGCLYFEKHLSCESGDFWYDRCCYCCLGPGSQNP